MKHFWYLKQAPKRRKNKPKQPVVLAGSDFFFNLEKVKYKNK